MWRTHFGIALIKFILCLHKVFFIDLFVLPVRQRLYKGEVTEWSKVLAWKVSVPQKGTGGSNPFLSARSEWNEKVGNNAKSLSVNRQTFHS